MAARGNTLLLRLAGLAAAPVLRLSIGRWPNRTELRQFASGLAMANRTLPPLLQALAEVHAVKERLNELNFWQGRPFSFLHFEKTAGTSLVGMMETLCHPLQINGDVNRGTAPHILSAFLPGQCEQVRRTSLVWGHYDLPALRRLDPDRIVVTILREPRSRILSLYRFWRSVDPLAPEAGSAGFNVAAAHRQGLLDFLRSDDPLIRNYIDNVYVRRLTGSYATPAGPDRLCSEPSHTLSAALRALHGLDLVGVVEKLDGFTALLGQLVGVRLPARLPRHNAAETNDRGSSPGFRKVARPSVTPEVEAELDRLTRYDRAVYDHALARLDHDSFS